MAWQLRRYDEPRYLVGREWVSRDELPGTRITAELIGDLAFDPRDVFSKDARVRAFEQLEADHITTNINRMYDAPRGARFRSQLLAGEMGDGKSIVATMRLRDGYGALGRMAFSNASILFGQHLSEKDLVTYANVVCQHAMTGIDEIHENASKFRDNSVASQMLHGSGLMLRKLEMDLLGMSAREDLLSGTYLTGVDDVTYLAPRFPEHGYNYPPWCYLREYRVGPKPYKPRTTLRDKHNINPIPRVQTRWRPLPASWVWDAAVHYDTYRQVIVGGARLYASDFKGSDDTATEQMRFALEGCQQLYENEWTPIGGDTFTWELLQGALHSIGVEVSDDTIRAIGRRVFNMRADGRISHTVFEQVIGGPDETD